MPKAILICGKLCSGKTTYAKKLQGKSKGVTLSVDELMLSLLEPYLGDKHEHYTFKAQKYLFDKSLEILAAGCDVILDWGFWTRRSREYAKEFYLSRGVLCEFHYIAIDDDTWRARIKERNDAVSAGQTDAYYVDGNLTEKFESMFEPPLDNEINVWVADG